MSTPVLSLDLVGKQMKQIEREKVSTHSKPGSIQPKLMSLESHGSQKNISYDSPQSRKQCEDVHTFRGPHICYHLHHLETSDALYHFPVGSMTS